MGVPQTNTIKCPRTAVNVIDNLSEGQPLEFAKD